MTDPMRLARESTPRHFDAVMADEDARRLQILREAGADVFCEINDGGHAEVVHDPAQLAFPGIPGSTDQTGRLTAMVENYDYAAQGEWMATVEQRLQRAFRMIEVATERLNGEHADQPNEKSIEDLRSDVRQLWYRGAR